MIISPWETECDRCHARMRAGIGTRIIQRNGLKSEIIEIICTDCTRKEIEKRIVWRHWCHKKPDEGLI